MDRGGVASVRLLSPSAGLQHARPIPAAKVILLVCTASDRVCPKLLFIDRCSLTTVARPLPTESPSRSSQVNQWQTASANCCRTQSSQGWRGSQVWRSSHTCASEDWLETLQKGIYKQSLEDLSIYLDSVIYTNTSHVKVADSRQRISKIAGSKVTDSSLADSCGRQCKPWLVATSSERLRNR